MKRRQGVGFIVAGACLALHRASAAPQPAPQPACAPWEEHLIGSRQDLHIQEPLGDGNQINLCPKPVRVVHDHRFDAKPDSDGEADYSGTGRRHPYRRSGHTGRRR